MKAKVYEWLLREGLATDFCGGNKEIWVVTTKRDMLDTKVAEWVKRNTVTSYPPGIAKGVAAPNGPSPDEVNKAVAAAYERDMDGRLVGPSCVKSPKKKPIGSRAKKKAQQAA